MIKLYVLYDNINHDKVEFPTYIYKTQEHFLHAIQERSILFKKNDPIR